jgi:tripartite-type tricarboxylate transporter receptor subunit TctC
MKDLIALAKARPAQVTYASSGNGNGNHLATELLASMAGMKLVHVPYKGGPPALTAVVQGEVNFMLANSTFAVGQVKSGRVRAIAVTTEQRLPLLPDVPTVAESGVPDFVVTTWFGFLAPAATPKPIVARLNKEIVQILGDTTVREKLDRAGLIAAPSTPEQFAAVIRSETVRWSKVIRETNATAD